MFESKLYLKSESIKLFFFSRVDQTLEKPRVAKHYLSICLSYVFTQCTILQISQLIYTVSLRQSTVSIDSFLFLLTVSWTRVDKIELVPYLDG